MDDKKYDEVWGEVHPTYENLEPALKFCFEKRRKNYHEIRRIVRDMHDTPKNLKRVHADLADRYIELNKEVEELTEVITEQKKFDRDKLYYNEIRASKYANEI